MTTSYTEKFNGYMTGESIPQVEDITAGFALFPEAIYINRHMQDFATNYWGFQSSTQPLSFAENLREPDPEMLAHFDATHTDGYIEIDSGVITTEYYAPGMQKQTPHCVHSVGKSWTSAIWADSLVPHMDKTLESIQPALAGSAYEGIALRQIVDMQAPIDWYEDYSDPESPVVVSGSACGFDLRQGTGYGLLDFIATLKKKPELKVGDWNYVSANTLLMSFLGSTLTGQHTYQRMADFYQQLGLEYRSGIVASFQGQVGADGGHSFALRDFVKLPYAMANRGKVNDLQVISKAYISDLFSEPAGYANAWQSGIYGSVLPQVSYYRNQWFVLNSDIAMGLGSYGQVVLFNRATQIAIAKFSTYKHGQDLETFQRDFHWLLQRIN